MGRVVKVGVTMVNIMQGGQGKHSDTTIHSWILAPLGKERRNSLNEIGANFTERIDEEKEYKEGSFEGLGVN